MGRRHLIQCWAREQGSRHKMILPVVSSVLLASMAFGAPGANYGAAARVSPAKQISSPGIQCRTEYVTLWDTEYKQDCQYEWRGHGNDKVWAPIEGTCQNVPYDE